MSFTSTKKIIIIHNFNFYEKILMQFKKFNKNKTKLHYFFKNWDHIETKNN